jgi:pilus assembly protein Flp/PilA
MIEDAAFWDLKLYRRFTCCAQPSRMIPMVGNFLEVRSEANAIEYGQIAASASLAINAAINGLGTNLRSKFPSIHTSLK